MNRVIIEADIEAAGPSQRLHAIPSQIYMYFRLVIFDYP